MHVSLPMSMQLASVLYLRIYADSQLWLVILQLHSLDHAVLLSVVCTHVPLRLKQQPDKVHIECK